MSTLADSVKDRLSRANGLLGQLKVEPRLDLIGRVERVGDNVASVRGLPDMRSANCRLFEFVLRRGRAGGRNAEAWTPTSSVCAMLGDDSTSARATWYARPVQSPACRWVTSYWVESLMRSGVILMDGGPQIEAAGIELVERRGVGYYFTALFTGHSAQYRTARYRRYASALPRPARTDNRGRETGKPRLRSTPSSINAKPTWYASIARWGRRLRRSARRSMRSSSTARPSDAFSFSHLRTTRRESNGWRRTPPARWRSISRSAAAMRC